MIDSEAKAPGEPSPDGARVTPGDSDAYRLPVTTLRGTKVQVDTRRVGRLAIAIFLAALTFVAIVLYVVGFQKNSQISILSRHGVAVEVTVSRCLGQLGGSGSNPVGYDCTGTYLFGGRRYTESIPGNALLPPGRTLRGVISPGDPALFSTPRVLATEHPSWRVFIVPTAILMVPVLLVGAFVLGKRRKRAAR